VKVLRGWSEERFIEGKALEENEAQGSIGRM
jgi:hypothetical protein